MVMPNNFKIDFPLNEAGDTVVVGDGKVYAIPDLVCGYDYTRDVAAVFTAELLASVSGQNWTQINDLTTSGQGEIGAHYRYIKIKCSVQGALGAGTLLQYNGKS